MNRKELGQMLLDAGIERCVGFGNINPSDWAYTSLHEDSEGQVVEFSMEKSFSDGVAACINYKPKNVGGEWYGDAIVNGMQSSHCDDSNSTFDNLPDAIDWAVEVAELEMEAAELDED